MNREIKKTLLLVEDEFLIALEKQQELEKYGYSVIHINTGEKAVAFLKENKQIDLILMDINLGEGIDGTEASELILKEHDIPVVFLSSYTEPEIVAKTEKITSYGYVVKSSSITVIDASIKMAFKLFEANMKIKESDEKHKTMLSNISDIIGIVGIDGIIKYKSPNIEKWFGWKPEDLVGTDILQNVHPDDLERILKVVSSLLESDDSTIMVEYQGKCKDGTFKPIELTATNLVKDLLINGVLLNYRDITKRKKAEEELRKGEELMRTMFEKSPLGIALVNSKTLKVREGNQRFAEILGISKEEMINVDWVQVTHPDDIEEDLDNMALLNSEKIPEFKMEKRYIRPDSSIVWVNMMIASVKIEKNRRYHLCMVEDITERKWAEHTITQQLTEKEIILKEVHHRIKNNFNSIVNLLSMQRNATDNEEVKTALNTAIGRVNGISMLYARLLLTDNYQTTSVKEYLSNLIDEIVTLFSGKLKLTIKKQLDDVQLDARKLFPLGIIINELLTNIMKYAFTGKESGLIEVILKKREEEIILTVQDSGIGLPDSFVVNEQKGFGLMLIRMLSEQLGGSFTITNHTGTKSTIKFPV